MPFKSILYVDDDPDICSIVRASLRLIPDLIVSTVASGEQAIDLAYEIRPDLVLMDVMMPGLDGPCTLRRMRASTLLADTPVVFMTAKVLPAEIAQLLELGAIGVIVKPFDPLKLYADLCALWAKDRTVIRSPGALDPESQVAAQVDALTASFLRRARADTSNLAGLIGLAQDGDRSVLEEIERLAHSLHGSGAMFGFPHISASGGAIARMAETLKSDHALRNSACDPTQLLHLVECSRQLAQHVEEAWQTGPQAGAMFQAATGAR